MMGATHVLFVLLAVVPPSAAENTVSAANPIRKVVTLLQNMVKKVEDEGRKGQELYDKFMCYCQTGTGDLQKSIDGANTKIPQVNSDLEAAEGKKAQLEKDVESHQSDRASAKRAMADATGVRGKEHEAFVKMSNELDVNIAALSKAIAALEKGMAGSFLQSNSAQIVKKLIVARSDIADEDQHEVLAFLSGSQRDGYAPQSGEITGILKQMHDEMSKDLQDAIAAEAESVKQYEELMAAKKKEVAALSAMIEEKLGRVADLGVEIATMKNDLTDTEEALVEDQKFLAQLQTSCKTKTAEWEEQKKTRAEELVALADTIKILNDDDALELFKKTLPSASASFMQLGDVASNMQTRALSLLQQVHAQDHVRLDFIAMALHGKKIGFEKVITMIDELVASLKQEQEDDNSKKEYCNNQFDQLDDKKKGLERKVSDLSTSMANAEDQISTLQGEIKALEAGIKALDKSVADATEQRRQEHSDYKELMANDGAAKEVLGFAKNRLNKFYNPKLYKAPAKRELSREDQISVGMGGTMAPTMPPGGIAGTGVSALQDAPPPPPASPTYAKKTEENSGVIAMIDLLVKDLDKEMTEAETTERDAQADYEKLMVDAASKRVEDSKSLTDKGAALADVQGSLEQHKADKASTSKELGATLQYIHNLHNECDWLLKYFDVRKEARASEIDALGKAKAVLSGADYSLLQTKRTSLLRRHQ